VTLTDYYVANTGEIVPSRGHTTKRISPPPRRPDASGEQPLYVPPTFVLADDRQRPDTTARIVTGSSWPGPPPAGPRRPRWYRGSHRLTRSRAALAAATAEARGRRDGA
jgi:hypothetical protein